MNEEIIFTLWNKNTDATAFRAIATELSVVEQLCDENGMVVAQSNLTKEQAIAFAKSILRKYNAEAS